MLRVKFGLTSYEQLPPALEMIATAHSPSISESFLNSNGMSTHAFMLIQSLHQAFFIMSMFLDQACTGLWLAHTHLVS